MRTFSINRDNLDKVRTKKLTYKGVTREFDVYRVPIDELFYNNLNGRIATYISQYESSGKKITDLDNKAYNDEIANYIRESSGEKRYNITKEDIRVNTQKEVGVVLTDGRVIDGNRRFTCLRDLFEETSDTKYFYFEAVVLDVPNDDDEKGWKEIGSLELELQIGTDEKVDYSPIDWLVRVYRDLVKNHVYTDGEYQRLTKYSLAQINMMKMKSEIMVDFLNFFEKPEQFYIAKQLELDGPLQELVKLKRKSSSKEWDKNKVVFYVYLWTATKGDKSREVRRAIGTVGTDGFDKLRQDAFSQAQRILSGEICPAFSLKPEITSAAQEQRTTSTVSRTTSFSSNSFENSLSSLIQTQSIEKAKNKPLDCCTEIKKQLSQIDTELVNRWKDEDMKVKFSKELDEIMRAILEIKKNVN